MLTEKTCSVNGITINYAEGPPCGTPLVMLHGITTWWQTFLPVLPSLLLRYHTYVLDQRGHGQSDRTPGEYYIRNYAEDVIAFLRDQVSESAFLLGWSLGAEVSIAVAAGAPDLVRAVVLEDPPLNELARHPDEERVAGVVERFSVWRHVITMDGSTEDRLTELATVQPGDDDALLRRRLKQLDICDPELLTFVIERMYTEQNHLEDLLPKIECPVLMIRTDPVSALTIEHAALANSLLHDSTQVAVENAGHNIHTTRPIAYSRIVSDFLESI